MTFFIVLFIVLMQFLWKHIDDLVGKGLPISLIAELFFYAAVSMVPMALPLAILLASLMTFGNFGEKFELTAMKASGISLFHAMRPLIVFISLIAVGAFFFQNDVLPPAQVKMWTLLFSMRQKSPEVEIPEGVFYDQIPGYNLLVQEKNRETGMLYNMMIYDVTRGGDNATILVADSGNLAFTSDMRYLYLHLFYGEQFENLREQKSLDKNVPFRREAFEEKEVLIPFDANFNRLDEGGMRNQYVGKNIRELRHTIDSVGQRLDSTGRIYTRELQYSSFPLLADREKSHHGEIIHEEPKESENKETTEIIPLKVDLDSLLLSLSQQQRDRVFEAALAKSKREVNEYQFKSLTVEEDKKNIRRHDIELLKKYTLSVACLIFFFIGAPLGAIIRKGGLGTPLVISVLLFLFYYIIDNTGYKLARDGHWVVWLGIWLSTFVLAPLGVYVTYKAMNDSAVFDIDRYKSLIRKLRGSVPVREVKAKEVIINDISPSVALEMISLLKERCKVFEELFISSPHFSQYWGKGVLREEIVYLNEKLDEFVSYMSDSRDNEIIGLLAEYPVLTDKWIYEPDPEGRYEKIIRILYPVSYVIYLIGKRKLKALMTQINKIKEINSQIEVLIQKDSAI